MQNFQNELQMLGMDNYQVGEINYMDPQSQDLRQFGGMMCGGGGRCGGIAVAEAIWRWRRLSSLRWLQLF